MDTKTASAFLFFGFLLVPAMFKKDLRPESWEEDFAKIAGAKDPEVIARLLKNCAGRIIRLGSEEKPKWAFVYQKYIAVEQGKIAVIPLGGWGEVEPHNVRRMMDVAKMMGIEWSEPFWMLGVQELEPPVGESAGGPLHPESPPPTILSEPSSVKPTTTDAGSSEISPPNLVTVGPAHDNLPPHQMGESFTMEHQDPLPESSTSSAGTSAHPPETTESGNSGDTTSPPDSSLSPLSGGPSDEGHPGLGPDDLIDPNADYSDVP